MDTPETHGLPNPGGDAPAPGEGEAGAASPRREPPSYRAQDDDSLTPEERARALESRPGDTEAVHAPEEGGAVRDPRLDPHDSADPLFARRLGEEPGRDRREDYGSTGFEGSERLAGAAAADRLPPEAASTHAGDLNGTEPQAKPWEEPLRTPGTGAMPDNGQGDEVDPGSG